MIFQCLVELLLTVDNYLLGSLEILSSRFNDLAWLAIDVVSSIVEFFKDLINLCRG